MYKVKEIKNMTDKELFEQILDQLKVSNNIDVERPFGDTYIELKKNGHYLGDMNYGGYNLAYCIYKLGKILDVGYDILFK